MKKTLFSEEKEQRNREQIAFQYAFLLSYLKNVWITRKDKEFKKSGMQNNMPFSLKQLGGSLEWNPSR